MIVINNAYIHPKLDYTNTTHYENKKNILQNLEYAPEIFRYDSIEELAFDVALRDAIVRASYALLNSGMTFEVFTKSTCNPSYWIRTNNGGFQQRRDVSSSKAIKDIFKNGSLYATECATAMIIILYGALLQLYDDETFDKLFPSIYLYTWNYNDNLALQTNTQGSHIIGDIIYFKNPQVTPYEPEWQGENVVVLGPNAFYGHGLGIKTAEEIIFYLNLKRIPFAFISAYLTDLTTRLDSKKMQKYANKSKIQTTITTTQTRKKFIVATIGQETFAIP
ncbi:MAG: protein-glutamine gamma-glutamyltransferase [Bacillaceae bacterium]